MDHNSIIDRKTYFVYTHAEDCPYAFVCDKRIAKTVALLNQKGYETLASCGGHYEGGCSEKFDVDIKFLKKAQDDPTCFIREIKENTFDCYIENRKAYIYILFKNKYNFDSLPEKCNPYEDEYEGRKRISIDYEVNYFDEHNQKRKRNDIEKDLDEYCNILYHWVEELPDINKRKDD